MPLGHPRTVRSGMVFLAVGFIMFPIVTTATDALLAYTFTTNVAIAGLSQACCATTTIVAASA